MPPSGVRFRGLRELDRALGKANKNLRRRLRVELKALADIVAQEAQHLAETKGLHKSGDLIRLIKSYALTGRAGVRSGAVHRGFNYPRRLEYEGRDGGEYGPRATLLPAFDEKAGDLLIASERLLDLVAQDFTEGGTPL